MLAKKVCFVTNERAFVQRLKRRYLLGGEKEREKERKREKERERERRGDSNYLF